MPPDLFLSAALLAVSLHRFAVGRADRILDDSWIGQALVHPGLWQAAAGRAGLGCDDTELAWADRQRVVLRGAALQGQPVASAAQGFSGQGRDRFRSWVHRRLRQHLGQTESLARGSAVQSELRLRLLWIQDGALWRRARFR